jgi:hypothetical protein
MGRPWRRRRAKAVAWLQAQDLFPVLVYLAIGMRAGRLKEVWDGANLSRGCMIKNGLGRSGVVNDHQPCALAKPLQQRALKVAGVSGAGTATLPVALCRLAKPFAIVVNKFFDVGGAAEMAEQQVMQAGIMQQHDAWLGDRLLVDLPVQAIVADLIEGLGGFRVDVESLAETRKQGGCVLGNPGIGRR